LGQKSPPKERRRKNLHICENAGPSPLADDEETPVDVAVDVKSVFVSQRRKVAGLAPLLARSRHKQRVFEEKRGGGRCKRDESTKRVTCRPM
jgi:hypothetical protein